MRVHFYGKIFILKVVINYNHGNWNSRLDDTKHKKRRQSNITRENKYKNGSRSKMDEKINSASKTIFNKKIINDILEKSLCIINQKVIIAIYNSQEF